MMVEFSDADSDTGKMGRRDAKSHSWHCTHFARPTAHYRWGWFFPETFCWKDERFRFTCCMMIEDRSLKRSWLGRWDRSENSVYEFLKYVSKPVFIRRSLWQFSLYTCLIKITRNHNKIKINISFMFFRDYSSWNLIYSRSRSRNHRFESWVSRRLCPTTWTWRISSESTPRRASSTSMDGSDPFRSLKSKHFS